MTPRRGLLLLLTVSIAVGSVFGVARWRKHARSAHLRFEGAFQDSCLSALRKHDAETIDRLLAGSGALHDSDTRAFCRDLARATRIEDSLAHPELHRKRALDLTTRSEWDVFSVSSSRKLSLLSAGERPGPSELSTIATLSRSCLEDFPSHLGCARIHAIATVELRFPDSLLGTLDSSRRRHPEDPVLRNAHALWLLRAGKDRMALEAFTEPTPFPVRPSAEGDFLWLATHRGRMAALVRMGLLDSAQGIADEWTSRTDTAPAMEKLRVVSTAAKTLEWIGCPDDASCLRDRERDLRLALIAASP